MFLHSMEELDKLRAERRPMVVLATPVSLNTGFSLELFSIFANHERNAVIFVEQGPEGSVARTVVEEYFKRQRQVPSCGHGIRHIRWVLFALTRQLPPLIRRSCCLQPSEPSWQPRPHSMEGQKVVLGKNPNGEFFCMIPLIPELRPKGISGGGGTIKVEGV